jgi:nucleotide-binding universal stress UspA family protein
MADAPILICYDGSDDARRGIDAAAALLGPRPAVVLDVAPPLTAVESLGTFSVAPVAAFEEANAADALRDAQEGAKLARLAGFDAVARGNVSAPTWEGVVELANEIEAPVIVIGSRGLNGGHELLEGSFSHDVARHAGRPVLIVPPPHGDR